MNIDEIICLSLDISKKRREHFNYYFSKLNIPFKYFIVKKHKKGGVYGCFHSHLQIIINAYKKNLEKILIFEDDAYPTSSFSNKKLNEAIEYMNNNDNCDCLFLGYFNLGINKDNNLLLFSQKINENIYKFNPLATHSYLLNRKGMEKIIKNYKNFIGICHYDFYLCKYAKLNNYCFVPMLFEQNYSLEYNVEPLNMLEFIGRKLYPLFNLIKINYNLSLLTYFRKQIIQVIIYLIKIYLILNIFINT